LPTEGDIVVEQLQGWMDETAFRRNEN